MEEFNQTLAELTNKRKKLINNEKTIRAKKDNEIVESTKIIENKYKQELEKISCDIEEIESDIQELAAKIIFYSYFNYRSIVKIMRDIIRIYEGESFIYREIDYCPNPKRRIITEKARILIVEKKESFIKRYCDKSKLYSILKNGDGIILDWDVQRDTSYINFYDATADGELKSNVKLSKFPYLKQFINFAISFCIENNLKRDLPLYELEKLKQEFIRNNVIKIKEYHEMVKFNEGIKLQNQVEKNAEYRNKQLIKALNKKPKEGI